jgi:UDPglucose--hexose-1-phosphate uridylyltransferase
VSVEGRSRPRRPEAAGSRAAGGSRQRGRSRGLGRLRDAFLALPPETPQEAVQRALEAIHAAGGFEAALECLHRWELAAGYITQEKLEGIERLRFPDPDRGLTFLLQVNHARTRYSDAQDRARARRAAAPPVPPPGTLAAGPEAARPCLLCRDNIGRPGKESLRVYELDLDGRGRRFFFQLTPFPLYPFHFVPVLSEHTPQRISARSLEDMFALLELAPSYAILSNSDVEWAGASILSHLHFQMLRGVRLPVLGARAEPGLTRSFPGGRAEFLDYPLAAFRFSGAEARAIRRAAGGLLEHWKGLDPGRNTVNLNLVRTPGPAPAFELVVLLRNPDYRTPERLRRFKSEGVGVVEASGEAILPVPRGPEAPEMWREIRERGLNLVVDLIAGNSPVMPPDRAGEMLEKAAEAL